MSMVLQNYYRSLADPQVGLQNRQVHLGENVTRCPELDAHGTDTTVTRRRFYTAITFQKGPSRSLQMGQAAPGIKRMFRNP